MNPSFLVPYNYIVLMLLLFSLTNMACKPKMILYLHEIILPIYQKAL
jgi:hypothetical protein